MRAHVKHTWPTHTAPQLPAHAFPARHVLLQSQQGSAEAKTASDFGIQASMALSMQLFCADGARLCLIVRQNMAACCHKQHTLISAALSMQFCTECRQMAVMIRREMQKVRPWGAAPMVS